MMGPKYHNYIRKKQGLNPLITVSRMKVPVCELSIMGLVGPGHSRERAWTLHPDRLGFKY